MRHVRGAVSCLICSAFVECRQASEESSLQAIGKAVELGINFLDTAWIYQSFGAGGGNFINEVRS